MQLGHHIPYPWLFFPGQWFRNQLMSEEQSSRECSAAAGSEPCFVFCSKCFMMMSLGLKTFPVVYLWKKTWFNGCFSHLSLQFCMLSGVLKSISSWQLVKSQRPPQKASSTPLWDSLEEEEHHFSEKKPAPLDRLPAQVQYCPTYYIKDSIDPDNVTLTSRQ